MPKSLSAHFTLEELVFSQTAARQHIDNSPSPDIVRNLTRLAAILEEVRDVLGGAPILVSSGYRSPVLNKAVGGAPDSYHKLGLAADFTAPKFGTVLQTARAVARSKIAYHKVIFEFGRWVHIDIPVLNEIPTRTQLSIFEAGHYLDGIVSKPA